jgi:hypothetical protein
MATDGHRRHFFGTTDGTGVVVDDAALAQSEVRVRTDRESTKDDERDEGRRRRVPVSGDR